MSSSPDQIKEEKMTEEVMVIDNELSNTKSVQVIEDDDCVIIKTVFHKPPTKKIIRRPLLQPRKSEEGDTDEKSVFFQGLRLLKKKTQDQPDEMTASPKKKVEEEMENGLQSSNNSFVEFIEDDDCVIIKTVIQKPLAEGKIRSPTVKLRTTDDKQSTVHHRCDKVSVNKESREKLTRSPTVKLRRTDGVSENSEPTEEIATAPALNQQRTGGIPTSIKNAQEIIKVPVLKLRRIDEVQQKSSEEADSSETDENRRFSQRLRGLKGKTHDQPAELTPEPKKTVAVSTSSTRRRKPLRPLDIKSMLRIASMYRSPSSIPHGTWTVETPEPLPNDVKALRRSLHRTFHRIVSYGVKETNRVCRKSITVPRRSCKLADCPVRLFLDNVKDEKIKEISGPRVGNKSKEISSRFEHSKLCPLRNVLCDVSSTSQSNGASVNGEMSSAATDCDSGDQEELCDTGRDGQHRTLEFNVPPAVVAMLDRILNLTPSLGLRTPVSESTPSVENIKDLIWFTAVLFCIVYRQSPTKLARYLNAKNVTAFLNSLPADLNGTLDLYFISLAVPKDQELQGR